MKPHVVLFDYGSGNIRSAERSLARAGADVEVSSDIDVALQAPGVVLPGVGAFGACMASLRAVEGPRLVAGRRWFERPLLGICVGHQVLFESGEELGSTPGLGVWPGAVSRVAAAVLPHIGWNTVSPPTHSTLFEGVEDERFYFVHSYAAHAESIAGWWTAPPVMTTTTYGDDTFVAAFEQGSFCSTQFHPEKSGDAGAALLRNWVRTL